MPWATAGVVMPPAVRSGGVEIVEIGAKWARTLDGVVRTPPPVWGVDLAHQLQPALERHYVSAQAEHIASGAVRCEMPLLAERWAPRRQAWTFASGEEPAPMTGDDAADAFEVTWVRALAA